MPDTIYPLRIPPRLYAALVRIAKAEERKVAEVIRDAAQRYVRNAERRAARQ